MAPKKIDKNENEKPKSPLHKTKPCGVVSPGPKYSLKTVTGYKNHCQSKYRNPAYSIKFPIEHTLACRSPGPKYFYKLPGIPGYSFTRATPIDPKCRSPGPKYALPGSKAPAYSMSFKNPSPCIPATPGPYGLPSLSRGPAYSFGLRGRELACHYNPPIIDVGSISLIREKGPAYTITTKHYLSEKCRSPGPKYHPPIMKKAPAYTFGVKHSECKHIPKIESDDQC